MRILLDNDVHYRFGQLLFGQNVVHVQDIRWESISNGRLLTHAADAGFDVLITADKNMRYQQNMQGRKISVILLNSHSLSGTTSLLWRHK